MISFSLLSTLLHRTVTRFPPTGVQKNIAEYRKSVLQAGIEATPEKQVPLDTTRLFYYCKSKSQILQYPQKSSANVLTVPMSMRKTIGAFLSEAVHCINLYYLCQKRYQTWYNFKSGISFLCWNDTRNRVLFQLLIKRFSIAVSNCNRQLIETLVASIVYRMAIVQILEIIAKTVNSGLCG